MSVLFIAIAVIGGLAACVGGIWFLMIAFRTSIGWGLACLLIPFAGLVFLVKHWQQTQLAFVLNIAGSIVFAGGMMGIGVYQASSSVVGLDNDPYAEANFEQGGTSTSDAWWPEEPVPTPAPVATGAATTATATDEPPPSATDAAEGDDFKEPDRPPIGTVGDDPELAPTAPTIRRDPPKDVLTPVRRWGRKIQLDELDRHIGAVIQINSVDKQTYKAVLLEVGTEQIKIRQGIGTGHMTYTVPLANIIAVRVNDGND